MFKMTIVIFLSLILQSILLAEIKSGNYACYTGDKISTFTLSSTNSDINLLYEKGNKRYKGKWTSSFNDAELSLYVKRITSYSSSKPITVEYLLSPSLSDDPSQFMIYKMIRGKKRLFCYATGLINQEIKKNKNYNNQQIIINNNINYSREK